MKDIRWPKVPKSNAAKMIIGKIRGIDEEEKEGLEALEQIEGAAKSGAASKIPSVFTTSQENAGKTENQNATTSLEIKEPQEKEEKNGETLPQGEPNAGSQRSRDAQTIETLPGGSGQTRNDETRKIPSGTGMLDAILGGGIPIGSIVLAKGDKASVAALSFVAAGTKSGENSIFLSLSRNADEIGQDASGIGADLDGVLLIPRPGATEKEYLKIFGGELFFQAKQIGAKRVAVEGITPSSGQEWKIAVAELCRRLRTLGATAMIAIEPTQTAGIEHLFNGEIATGAGRLQVLKMWRTDYDASPHEY